jgi:hypothetical protein
MNPAKVDGADLGEELRVKLLEFQRHRSRNRLTVDGESNVPTTGSFAGCNVAGACPALSCCQTRKHEGLTILTRAFADGAFFGPIFNGARLGSPGTR